MNNEFYKKIIRREEWEFEFQQREMHPVIMSDLWIRAVRDCMPRELKLPVKGPDYLFTAAYKGYIKSADKKDILQKLRSAVENPAYLQYIFERTMGVIKEFDAVAVGLVLGLTPDISGWDLAVKWQTFEKKFLKMIPWFWIPWYLTEENILSDRVKKGLEFYRNDIEKVTDFNTALGTVLFPVKEAVFQREQRDFFKLVALAARDTSFEKNAEFEMCSTDYLARYSWMRTYFLLPLELLSYKELVERVKEGARGGFPKEYEFQEKKKVEFRRIAKQLFEIFKEDRGLRQAIDDARELGWLLTASVEEGILVTSRLIPFYKLLAQKIGVPYERWVYLASEEVTSSLTGGRKVSVQELEERTSACAVLMQSGNVTWMYGRKAKKFSEWIESGVGVIPTNVIEFSGQPAYRGKVSGTVRLALTSKEAGKIVAGEILVTSMTSPDYVPAMRKAGAIVTNEGGLLSHAAIISREFGKPCIVGTKIATKVLKDGDVVEVDANKGVVKIIKRA